MSDLKDLEETMRKMAERLEANPNDEEARVILDRAAELFWTMWKDAE